MLITHSQDPNSENADISGLMDKMTAARNAFFDRKRIRANEVFFQGALAYLTTFNEGDTKSDFVEQLQRQMQAMLDLYLGENKLQLKVNPNSLYLAFKDKQDRLSRKVYRLEFLTNLSHKLKVNNTPETFFAYLQEMNIELDVTASRLDKALAFTKSNVEPEQDEAAFAKLGAKIVHRIVSGQF